MAALNTRLEGGAPLLVRPGGWRTALYRPHLAYLPIFFPQLDLGAYPHVQASIEATQGRVAYQAAMATG